MILAVFAYVALLSFVINKITGLVPDETKWKLLIETIIIMATIIVWGLFAVLLIYPYSKFEELIIEKVIPQNIKILFNIDKIEETFTSKYDE